MRNIDDHKVNPANDTLTITVTDEPGSGGANHAYQVSGFDLSKNPSAGNGVVHDCSTSSMVYFQNGPIPEVGVNGVTNEALLAIVADRLRSFQKGAPAADCDQIGRNVFISGIGYLIVEDISFEEIENTVFGFQLDFFGRQAFLCFHIAIYFVVETAFQFGALSGQFLRIQ